MKPARFSYEAPSTLAGALAALAARGEDAKIIAGGQSLAPMMNMRIAQPGHLVDINRITELGEVRREAGALVCGALVRHADLERNVAVRAHAPMLAHAAGTIGHYAIRQRGTLGGSLAHADPAAQLPLVAVALDATIEVASEGSRRMIPAGAFIRSIFTTALMPTEVLVALHVPLAQPGEGWGFRLFARRAGDFALALVACRLSRLGDGHAQVNIALGGIGPAPVRLDRVIATSERGWAAEASRALAADAPVEENERISAQYRRELIEALAADALTDAWERAT